MAPPGPDAKSAQRVALITSIAFSIANFRGPLVREMIARGCIVHALAPDYDDRTRDAVRALGAHPVDISLDRTGIKPLRDMRDAVRLRATLRRLSPDVTFSYFIKPVIYGSLAAWAAGVSRRYALVAGLGYVFTPDGGTEPVMRKILRLAAMILYASAFRVCDRIFFQNAEDERHFLTAGVLHPDKVVRLNGTGVDLSSFRPAAFPNSPLTFLLMARLLREKGICEFAEAARLVRQAAPETRFVLLGALDPNPGALSSAEIEQWCGEGLIEWHGHVDDVRPWIAGAHVYVLPSYREGKPRSTQEAMAMGRPVITTDAPGCRDTVADGVNGFQVPVRDAAALAAAMLRFVRDPALVGSMGRSSRAMAEKLFDVHVINDAMLAAMNIDGPAAIAPRAAGA